VLANDEQIKEMNSTADQFINNKLFDTNAIKATIQPINAKSKCSLILI
jgi:hypothetical protein